MKIRCPNCGHNLHCLFTLSVVDSWRWYRRGETVLDDMEKCESDVSFYNELFDQLDQLFIAA